MVDRVHEQILRFCAQRGESLGRVSTAIASDTAQCRKALAMNLRA